MEVERECVEEEEEEDRGKLDGHRGQTPLPRPVATHHGPWGSPLSDRGVCWIPFFVLLIGHSTGRIRALQSVVHNIFFSSFFFPSFFLCSLLLFLFFPSLLCSSFLLSIFFLL